MLARIILIVGIVAGTPIVLWHGMGDNCCHEFSMGAIEKMIMRVVPSTHYLKSLMIGDSPAGDTTNGFLMPVPEQIQLACQQIRDDPKLKDGYNALGFSQGGQFLRAVAQTCPDPPMKTLVTFGGQHRGIFGFPKCPGSYSICEYVRKMLNWGAYTSFVQSHLVQAQYWHDPLQEETYEKYSQFIGPFNNALDINHEYRENLKKLEHLVMVMFKKDSMVVPKQSAHFGYYIPGQDQAVESLFESRLYKEDRLGLKVLNDTGRLHFLEMEGDHLQFTESEFAAQIAPFL